ncbi:hypothetical protein T07_7671 [Trichinella nelsoni]|uniref:Uncharacterized protein n=1 Tax=Trichinella nelsoni TaxID=6336 RepID=A0A0V0RQI3_9BILA|nr:hypothetical protein T07_7671 [Trichinella nelsoni]
MDGAAADLHDFFGTGLSARQNEQLRLATFEHTAQVSYRFLRTLITASVSRRTKQNKCNRCSTTSFTGSFWTNKLHPVLIYNVSVQCNGLSVKAGGPVTVLLFLVVSSPSELTLRQSTLFEEDMCATATNHNTTDRSPEPHTNIRTPSGSNVPPTVAECYGVVVHDQLGLS